MVEDKTRYRGISLAIAGVLAALTLQPGLGFARATRFTRGDQVREQIPTGPSERKRVGMVVTVVAEPGDRIKTKGAMLWVNDVRITSFSAELIATAARSGRLPDRMPEDQYLVMGESRDPLNNVVRKWGIYATSALERAVD